MIMETYENRSKLLIGEENFRKLENKVILIVGVGGVGGTVLECLARSGVKKFVIIDHDVVSPSNLNRQILFIDSDIGESKVEAAKNHIKSINSQIEVVTIQKFFDSSLIEELSSYKFDYIVDAIDSINSKVELIKYALNKNIEIICSLGMANRLDPSKVVIERLDKTYNCPLAKKLRVELRKAQVDLKKVMCAFSKETPIVKNITPASMMMVPSSAGLNIASYIISKIIGGEN